MTCDPGSLSGIQESQVEMSNQIYGMVGKFIPVTRSGYNVYVLVPYSGQTCYSLETGEPSVGPPQVEEILLGSTYISRGKAQALESCHQIRSRGGCQAQAAHRRS